MQESKHTQIQYEQHTAYLEDLLKKHERGEGIRYEDLQHSWKSLLKKCKDCNQEPMEELKTLHETLLSEYKSAAQRYYESIVKSYKAPAVSMSQKTLSGYINESISKVKVFEHWHVEYPELEAWLWKPIRDVLSVVFKKELLQRKLNALKQNQKHNVAASEGGSTLPKSIPITKKKEVEETVNVETKKVEDSVMEETKNDESMGDDTKDGQQGEILEDHTSEQELNDDQEEEEVERGGDEDEEEKDDEVDEEDEDIEDEEDEEDDVVVIDINEPVEEETIVKAPVGSGKTVSKAAASNEPTSRRTRRQSGDGQTQTSNKRKQTDTASSSAPPSKKKSNRGRGRGRGRSRGGK